MKTNQAQQIIQQSIQQSLLQISPNENSLQNQMNQQKAQMQRRNPLFFDYFDKKMLTLPPSQIAVPTYSIQNLLYYQPIQKLNQQLLQGKVQLPKQQRKFKLTNSQIKENNLEELESQKLNQLDKKRQQTIDKLRQLQKQHLQLKMQRIYTFNQKKRHQSTEHINKYATVTDSKQQNKIVTKILQAKRQFESELTHKNKQLSRWYYQKALEQQKSMELELKRKQQYRRSIVSEHLKSMELRSQSKKKLMDISLKESRKLKSRRYMHDIFIQKQKLRQLEQQKNKQLELQKIKERNKLDINDIRDHQRQYEDRIARQKSKSKVLIKSERGHYQSNYFTRLAKMELEQLRQRQQMKHIRGQQIKQKMAIYQSYLDSQVRPKIVKSKKPFVIKQTRGVQAMTHEQLRQRGLKNLEIAKKLKMDNQSVLLKNKSQSVKLISQNQTSSSYIDYLKQFKKPNRQDQNQKQFKNLINSGSLSDYDSVTKAFVLAQKMAAQSKKLNDQKMYYSAKNKLDLLNNMI